MKALLLGLVLGLMVACGGSDLTPSELLAEDYCAYWTDCKGGGVTVEQCVEIVENRCTAEEIDAELGGGCLPSAERADYPYQCTAVSECFATDGASCLGQG